MQYEYVFLWHQKEQERHRYFWNSPSVPLCLFLCFSRPLSHKACVKHNNSSFLRICYVLCTVDIFMCHIIFFVGETLFELLFWVDNLIFVIEIKWKCAFPRIIYSQKWRKVITRKIHSKIRLNMYLFSSITWLCCSYFLRLVDFLVFFIESLSRNE